MLVPSVAESLERYTTTRDAAQAALIILSQYILLLQVKSIEEEEYCLIPMGGVLPQHPQRVLALGGTAGMVHPSTGEQLARCIDALRVCMMPVDMLLLPTAVQPNGTAQPNNQLNCLYRTAGFMVSRMLGAAPTVADAIIDQLCSPTDRAERAAARRAPASEEEAAAMAAAVWRATWPTERIRQRAFFSFGMDMLLSLNLAQMREFFAAFFSLSPFHWHGFLSARLSFPELIGFGLSLFVQVRLLSNVYHAFLEF